MPTAPIPAFQGITLFANPSYSADPSRTLHIPVALCPPIPEAIRLCDLILVVIL